VKLRDLERHLRAHGAELGREGSNHSIWRHEEATSAVPRHREIKTSMARAICRQLGVPDPPSR